jgi:hypothetical protein
MNLVIDQLHLECSNYINEMFHDEMRKMNRGDKCTYLNICRAITLYIYF